MAVEEDGVPIPLQRLRPIAELEFAKRQMPAQMTIEKADARIGREPRGQIGARRLRFAALVADMDEAVRAVRVLLVHRHGSLDLRAGRRELSVFG